jgi:hypothetical protein
MGIINNIHHSCEVAQSQHTHENLIHADGRSDYSAAAMARMHTRSRYDTAASTCQQHASVRIDMLK